MRRKRRHKLRYPQRNTLFFESLETRVVLDAGAAGEVAAATVEDGADVTSLTLEKFASESELATFLIDQAVERWDHLFDSETWHPYPLPLFDGHFGFPRATEVAASSSDQSNLYGLNIQVPGVSESDIVQTDGDYLYVLSNSDLSIIDVTDPTNLRFASQIEFENWGGEMYLSGDRLTVVTSDFGSRPFDLLPPVIGDVAGLRAGPDWQNTTTVSVFDIADRTAPALLTTTEFDGALVDSRAVGDSIYVITSNDIGLPAPQAICEEHEDTGNPNGLINPFDVSSRINYVADARIYWPTNPTQVCTYESETEYVERWASDALTNLSQYSVVDAARELVVGDVITAAENIYKPTSDGQSNLLSISIIDVAASIPAPVASTSALADPASTVYMSDQSIYVVGSNWFAAGMTGISKFDVAADGTSVDLAAIGEVNGRLLNQFSLDEHNGNLRVATTSGLWNAFENNLYVLQQNDASLDIIGSIEGLAEGEQIYSTRFMGDQAFIVTFRRIDPLFAIDLSDPENPTVAGELKIPGFSNYLQPIGDGFLVGIGRPGEQNFRDNDLQISLFDVNDLSDPQRTDQFIIDNNAQTWSPALYDHQAVGYFGEHQIIAIPTHYTMIIDEDDLETTGDSDAMNEEIFERWGTDVDANRLTRFGIPIYVQVYELRVVQIDPSGGENAITHLATISHSDAIQRSLLIDGNLFSVSNDTIKVHDLDDLSVLMDELHVGPHALTDHQGVDALKGEQDIDVLANDAGDSEDITIISVNTTGTAGSVAIADDGKSVLYTPADGITSYNDSFSYTIEVDGRSDSATVYVQLHLDSVHEKMVDLAKEDLAERLGINADEIRVDWVQEKIWTDSCLDIPSDEGCADVIVPGLKITLATHGGPDFSGESIRPAVHYFGNRFVYHTDTEELVLLAESHLNLRDDEFDVELGDENVQFDVLANDNLGGTIAQIVDISETQNGGTVTISDDGKKLLFTPGAEVGRDGFTYTVSLGEGVTDTAHVSIRVGEDNPEPISVDDLVQAAKEHLANELGVPTSEIEAVSVDPTFDVPSHIDWGEREFEIDDNVAVAIKPYVSFVESLSERLNSGPRPFGPMNLLRLANHHFPADGHFSGGRPTVHFGISVSVILRHNADLYRYYADTEGVVEQISSGTLGVADNYTVLQDSAEIVLDVLRNDLLDLPFRNSFHHHGLTIGNVSEPDQGGTAVIGNAAQVILYTPAEDFSGTETFTYTIDDVSVNVTVEVVDESTIPDVVGLTVEFVNASGEVITDVEIGEEFAANLYVEHLELGGNGVFAAYADLEYDSSLVTVNGTIEHSEFYQNGIGGNADTPGLIDEVGGFGGTNQLDGGRYLVASIPFVANAEGEVRFSTNEADDLPGHEILVFGNNDPVGRGEVSYGEASLAVVNSEPTDTNSDGDTTPLDVLRVINHINSSSLQPANVSSAEGESRTGQFSRLDVNRDGVVSAADALMVINAINAASKNSKLVAEGEPANFVNSIGQPASAANVVLPAFDPRLFATANPSVDDHPAKTEQNIPSASSQWAEVVSHADDGFKLPHRPIVDDSIDLFMAEVDETQRQTVDEAVDSVFAGIDEAFADL